MTNAGRTTEPTFRPSAGLLFALSVLAYACATGEPMGSSPDLRSDSNDEVTPSCDRYDGWGDYQYTGQFFELDDGETTPMAFDQVVIASDDDFISDIQREQAWAALAVASGVTADDREAEELAGGGPWSWPPDGQMGAYSIELPDGTIYDVISYYNIADNQRGAIFMDDTTVPVARIVENGDLVGCEDPGQVYDEFEEP